MKTLCLFLLALLSARPTTGALSRQTTSVYDQRNEDCMECYTGLGNTACLSLVDVCETFADSDPIGSLDDLTQSDYDILQNAVVTDSLYCQGVHERLTGDSTACLLEIGTPFDLSAQGLAIALLDELEAEGFEIVESVVTFMTPISSGSEAPSPSDSPTPPDSLTPSYLPAPFFLPSPSQIPPPFNWPTQSAWPSHSAWPTQSAWPTRSALPVRSASPSLQPLPSLYGGPNAGESPTPWWYSSTPASPSPYPWWDVTARVKDVLSSLTGRQRGSRPYSSTTVLFDRQSARDRTNVVRGGLDRVQSHRGYPTTFNSDGRVKSLGNRRYQVNADFSRRYLREAGGF